MAVAQQVEGHAMVGSRAILTDGDSVSRGRVAHVVIPFVHGVFVMQPHHAIVAVGLGEDGSGGDGKIFSVTLDDACVWQVMVLVEAIAVDDEFLRTHVELVDGSMHGGDAGTENVHLVNFLVRDDAYSPSHGIALNLGTQLVALLCRQLLRVVE